MDQSTVLPRQRLLPTRPAVSDTLTLSSTALLAAIVGISAAARTAIAFVRVTPTYFPDEYLYSAMSRSVAESGRPLVRGASSHIPSLLGPILTAPAWLIGDTHIAYVVAQVIGAIAMSLAAIPVYALANVLGLRRGVALGAAAFSVCIPGMMYATTLIAEPFAYPLALAALLTGTIALGRGSARAQIAFAVIAGAAALARVQLLIIPLAYIVAVFVAGIGSRSLGTVLRRQGWLLGVLALPPALVVAAPGILGVYGHSGATALSHGDVASSLARNGLILLYASGWLIVPAAILGLVGVVVRPRSQMELGFGALAGTLSIGLLLQASLWGETDKAQERYFIYALPILAIGFALAVDRGAPKRLCALLAAATIPVAAAFPLSGYAEATMKVHSPTLWGVSQIEEHLGKASGAFAVSLVAVALSLALIGLLFLAPQRAAVLGLALASAGCLALGAAASTLDLEVSHLARAAAFPSTKTWIDDAHAGTATFLRNGGSRGDAFSQLVWNRTLRKVLLMPDADPLDIVDERRVTIADDGTLLYQGQPVSGPVVVDQWSALMRFRNARLAASAPSDDLFVPGNRAQLQLYAAGFFRDGGLANKGSIHLWPEHLGGTLSGHFVFRVSTPAWFAKPIVLTIKDLAGTTSRTAVPPGASHTMSLLVCSRGAWAARFMGNGGISLSDHVVSLYTTQPRWQPDASACSSA